MPTRLRPVLRPVLVPVLLLSALAAAPSARAAPPTPLHYPAPIDTGAWSLGCGLSLEVLPTALVEAEQRLVPRLSTSVRVGLPVGFSFFASLDAIVLTNELRVGLRWAAQVGPVSLAVSDRLGLWFGWVGVEGFDTKSMGLIQYPGLSVGLKLGRHRLSAALEAIIVHGQRVWFGTATVKRATIQFAGFGLRLIAESPVGGHLLYYGATVLRASPDYQLWLAFSDAVQKSNYVRFLVGYEF